MGATSNFFSLRKSAAIQATRGSKIFPETVLSAAALESSNGTSKLAKDYNNYFGVKSSASWKGKVISLPTKEFVNGKFITVNQNFRWYATPADSFADYVRLLSTPRYVKAGVTTAATPQKQFEAIQAAGYATDPAYSTKLKNMLKSSGFKKVAAGAGLVLVALFGALILLR